MMKKLVLFVFVLAFAVSFGSAYALQKTDVVAVWMFDEGKGKTVEDTAIAQDKHDGEIVGGVEWTEEGHSGKALDFIGDDDNQVVVPHKSALSLSEFTITAWVKVQPRPGDRAAHWYVVMLKEGDDGFVAPGDTSGLGLKEKRDLNNLLGAENKDRKTLYEEVAKALKIDSSQTGRIAEIFAKEWQKSIK